VDDPSRQPFHLTKGIGSLGQLQDIAGNSQLKRFTSSPLMVTGLKNNTWYQLRVGAGNLAGDGPLSNPCAPVRTLALPAPATNLRISFMTTTLTRLTWNCLDECAKEATFFDVRYFPVSLDFRKIAGPSSSSSGQLIVNVIAKVVISYSVDLNIDIANYTSSSGIVFHIYSGSWQGQEDKGATITLPSAATDLRVTSSTEYALSFAWQPHLAADTFQVPFALNPKPKTPNRNLKPYTVNYKP
jgi:hypothetical protein